MSTQMPHIVMLPSPGLGHLIPIVEFAKLLVSRHHFSSTFIIPSASSPPPKAQEALLQSLPENLDYILLCPSASTAPVLENVGPEAEIALTITNSLPMIRDTFATLRERTRLAAIVTDPFGIYGTVDVAKEFDVPLYLYFGTAAMNLVFTFHLPRLDEEVKCEYKDMQDPVKLPGCVPLHGRDFASPVMDRASDIYKGFLDMAKRIKLVDGILLNSFMELEPGAIQALHENNSNGPPVYPIGPIIQAGFINETNGSDCLRWLDNQPSGSVLYVSFGSGGTLSHGQFLELALGLEMSQQRFLWVARSPNDSVSCPSYCGGPSQEDPLSYLPKGFLERIEGRGLVVPHWTCQIKVLSHSSTRGFVTHCGWNSTLESIMHGVPLIVWPLYAEQRTNAVLLNEDLKIALRLKVNESGHIKRDEISEVVKNLMGEGGNFVRNRALELKDAANRALGVDGSSTKALSNVALRWADRTGSQKQ